MCNYKVVRPTHLAIPAHRGETRNRMGVPLVYYMYTNIEVPAYAPRDPCAAPAHDPETLHHLPLGDEDLAHLQLFHGKPVPHVRQVEGVLFF